MFSVDDEPLHFCAPIGVHLIARCLLTVPYALGVSAIDNFFDYELIDFGLGRKLERFGKLTLDRPCPAAMNATKQLPNAWNAALRIDDGKIFQGQHRAVPPPEPWSCDTPMGLLTMRLTPYGHVGLFPEQKPNWMWFSEVLENVEGTPRALNLFGYTGASTLALACSGAAVTHVDASAPSVKWARQNAEDLGLRDHPIRWLIEDASKYAAREMRRGSVYDIIALDPPSYGHTPNGKEWRLSTELPQLLEHCSQLLSEKGKLLLTAHCTEPSQAELLALTKGLFQNHKFSSQRLTLVDRCERQLDAGFSIRSV